MKNTMFTLLIVTAMSAGCAMREASEAQQEDSRQATSNRCFVECYYAYYSDAAHTNLVGECESGPGTQLVCWGIKTSFRTGGCWQTCEPFEGSE